MRRTFIDELRCPICGERYSSAPCLGRDGSPAEVMLVCVSGHRAPLLAGVPRLGTPWSSAVSVKTGNAFGEEWTRYPQLLDAHRAIFDWYFEGPTPISWKGLRVLDAGCGMGRWLHFALEKGPSIVGMDVSSAIDVAAAREGGAADFVQADLRWPPFPPASFDLVYSLGVLHHLEEPLAGVRALAKLVRPGGQLRFYVYRSLEDEPGWKRALFAAVTGLRRVTTRLPYSAVHGVSWLVAAIATVLFIWPRRLLRKWAWGDRLTRRVPLVHYTDVPFRMVVSEQFDRLVAPIEGRYGRADIEAWLRDIGFEIVAILPGLGWRAIARRPVVSA